MTDPLFGVVTAFGRPEFGFLALAAESLSGLMRYHRGRLCGVQWIVALDAPGLRLGSDDPLDGWRYHRSRILKVAGDAGLDVEIVVNDSPGGSAAARNAALALLRAPWMVTLDADDVVVASGISTMLEAIEAVGGAEWAAGRCPNIGRDGGEIWAGPEDPFPPGLVEAGMFWEEKLRCGRLPFICAATLASTRAVRSVGGWPSRPRPRGADTALWAVLTSRYRGVWVPEVVYRYRRHSASVTMQPGFFDSDERLDEIARMVAAGTTQILA